MQLTVVTAETGHQLDEPNPQMEAGKAGHLQSPIAKFFSKVHGCD